MKNCKLFTPQPDAFGRKCLRIEKQNHDRSHFSNLEPHEQKERPISWRKNPVTQLQSYIVSHLQKNPQTFLGFLYIASEMTLLPRVLRNDRTMKNAMMFLLVSMAIHAVQMMQYILLLFATYSIFSPCSPSRWQNYNMKNSRVGCRFALTMKCRQKCHMSLFKTQTQFFFNDLHVSFPHLIKQAVLQRAATSLSLGVKHCGIWSYLTNDAMENK